MGRKEELEDEARQAGYADGFAGKPQFSSLEEDVARSPYIRKAYLEEYEIGNAERERLVRN